MVRFGTSADIIWYRNPQLSLIATETFLLKVHYRSRNKRPGGGAS